MARFKLKKLVEAFDGKAHNWKQDDFLKGQLFGKGGVCAPLSAKWIKDKKLGLNFKTDTESSDGREEVFQMKLNQHQIKKAEYIRDYLKMVGLHEVFNKQYQKLTLDLFMSDVKSGGYYFIGFSSIGVSQQASGHALAIDMKKLMFFDPNFGQAKFDNEENLKLCFMTLIHAIYDDMTGQAMIQKFV